MIYTTEYSKYVVCPLWKERITIRGKYRLSEDVNHPYDAHFMYATCPIVENLKNPQYKRNNDYQLFSYCNHEPCKLLNNFKEVIDVRKSY